mgnify:CR=1 FL=1
MPDDVPHPAALPDPRFRFFADLSVQVGPPQEVGATAHGGRRLIPILGGTAQGDGWSARVLPGGADFQRIVHGGLAELDARYVLETDAGDLIYVCNQALRSGDPAHMAKLARGEPVDPAHIYFRCAPRMETASRALAWINERLFFGTGISWRWHFVQSGRHAFVFRFIMPHVVVLALLCRCGSCGNRLHRSPTGNIGNSRQWHRPIHRYHPSSGCYTSKSRTGAFAS